MPTSRLAHRAGVSYASVAYAEYRDDTEYFDRSNGGYPIGKSILYKTARIYETAMDPLQSGLRTLPLMNTLVAAATTSDEFRELCLPSTLFFQACGVLADDTVGLAECC